jgi:hypothetical protein
MTASVALAAIVVVGSGMTPLEGQIEPLPDRFPGGIYFLTPRLDQPTGYLTLLGGELPVRIDVPVVGYDLHADSVAFPDIRANVNAIHIVTVGGSTQTVALGPPAGCIGHMSRSPDGNEAALMGAIGGCRSGPPSNIDIFIADMATGATEAVVTGPYNEEFPEWSPRGDRIAYFVGDPTLGETSGNNLVFFDTAARMPAGGAFEPGVDQTAFSKDGRLLLSGHALSVYDVATGAKVADLKEAALRGLAAAGYELDTRFPGQGGTGTFPLDGGFSPDGKTIVFDGAVRQGTDYGMLLCSIDMDGSNFKVLAGPFPVEPSFTNNQNWSSLNPTWLPCDPLGPPTGLTASVGRTTATLVWDPAGPDATSYIVEAGSAPGVSDVMTRETAAGSTSLTASGLGRGPLYVRVRATNACGVSEPSQELVIETVQKR